MKLFWLSFCDDSLPTGSQFLGACIVEARDFGAAVERTWELGINPGGEVLGLDVPEDKEPLFAAHKDKLLSKADLAETFGDEMKTLGELKHEGASNEPRNQIQSLGQDQ